MIRQSIQRLTILAQELHDAVLSAPRGQICSSFRLRRTKRCTAKLVIRRQLPEPVSKANKPVEWHKR
jgi:hypothetical protein